MKMQTVEVRDLMEEPVWWGEVFKPWNILYWWISDDHYSPGEMRM